MSLFGSSIRISSTPPTIIGVEAGYFARKAARVRAPTPPPPGTAAPASGKARARPAAPAPRHTWGSASTAWRSTTFRPWNTGDLADDHPGLGIVLTDRVLSDVDEPLTVHVHAVALRRVE